MDPQYPPPWRRPATAAPGPGCHWHWLQGHRLQGHWLRVDRPWLAGPGWRPQRLPAQYKPASRAGPGPAPLVPGPHRGGRAAGCRRCQPGRCSPLDWRARQAIDPPGSTARSASFRDPQTLLDSRCPIPPAVGRWRCKRRAAGHCCPGPPPGTAGLGPAPGIHGHRSRPCTAEGHGSLKAVYRSRQLIAQSHGRPPPPGIEGRRWPIGDQLALLGSRSAVARCRVAAMALTSSHGRLRSLRPKWP
jgi:hypothetical protein